jgi:hypothetical protein
MIGHGKFEPGSNIGQKRGQESKMSLEGQWDIQTKGSQRDQIETDYFLKMKSHPVDECGAADEK